MLQKMIYLQPRGTSKFLIGAVTHQNANGLRFVKIINSPFFTKTFDECILDGQKRVIYSAIQDGSKKIRTYCDKLGRPKRLTVMNSDTGVFLDHTLDKFGSISKTKEVVVDGRTIKERIVDAFGNLISLNERQI